MHPQTRPLLVIIIACHLFSTQPLPGPMLACCLDSWEPISMKHYRDVIMSAIASQTTGFSVVSSTVYSKKTSTFRVTGLCEGNPPVVHSPHKGPVTRKMFSFDDVIMLTKDTLSFEQLHLKMSFAKWRLFLLRPQWCYLIIHMMTASNGNIFRVTGHLCGEFTGPRWIPHTKASDAELWCFLWSAPE